MITYADIEGFLAEKTLALVGASRTGKKFGNSVLRELLKKGYTVHPVHPRAERIDGVACYPSLAELPDGVGGLVVVLKPAATEQIVAEAKEAGIPRIWLQQGAESKAAISFCRESGLSVVHGECILMFAQPTGIHKFHRWLWGLFGKLPRDQV